MGSIGRRDFLKGAIALGASAWGASLTATTPENAQASDIISSEDLGAYEDVAATGFSTDGSSLNYTMAAGDNLWVVQQASGVYWKDIADANGIGYDRGNGMGSGVMLTVPQEKIVSILLGVTSGDTFTVDDVFYSEETVMVSSTAREGVQIPATVIVPDGDGPFPAIVCNHGHGGARVNHLILLHALANAGIASVAPDFSGCGDSAEPWTAQNMESIIDDSNDAMDYLLAQYSVVDKTKLGIIGYSIGARAACSIIGSADNRYCTAVMLAPFVGDGQYWARDLLGTGGYETYDECRDYAECSGWWAHYGLSMDLHYSPEWFDDLFNSKPLEGLPSYTGSLFAVFGGSDGLVLPATCRKLLDTCTAASDVRGMFIDVADHNLAFPEGAPGNVSRRLIQSVTTWLCDKFGIR